MKLSDIIFTLAITAFIICLVIGLINLGNDKSVHFIGPGELSRP